MHNISFRNLIPEKITENFSEKTSDIIGKGPERTSVKDYIARDGMIRWRDEEIHQSWKGSGPGSMGSWEHRRWTDDVNE